MENGKYNQEIYIWTLLYIKGQIKWNPWREAKELLV